MLPEEKSKLLELFATPETWCQHAEAIDATGEGVSYDDDHAVAWDLSGALCKLFGWKRAHVLFEHMSRHMLGVRKLPSWPA